MKGYKVFNSDNGDKHLIMLNKGGNSRAYLQSMC